MVESLEKLQQLMAESRFVEAEKLVEVYLIDKKYDGVHELQLHYFEILLAQGKKIPAHFLLSFIKKKLDHDIDLAQKWIKYLDRKDKKHQQSLYQLEISISEKLGMTDELYRQIYKFLICRLERKQTFIPENILINIKTYFNHDFDLKLLDLSMSFLILDLPQIEDKVQSLILSCLEDASNRGLVERIKKLYEVLNSQEKNFHIELYKSICWLLINQIEDKKDFKKLIELVIYFEDIKFQVIILLIMDKNQLISIAQNYADQIKRNTRFNYVYVSKHFSCLKIYFSKNQLKKDEIVTQVLSPLDLTLDEKIKTEKEDREKPIVSSEEKMIPHLVILQSYELNQLLDLSVSLYQAEYYYAASEVSKIASQQSRTNTERLKAIYLKITSLLRLNDFRAVIDESLEALKISENENDILSFLYSLGDAYLQLGQKREAKGIFKKIVAIDEKYRLAKIKLEELDAL
jgi:hypothetical protein